jgi:hypothetical protein
MVEATLYELFLKPGRHCKVFQTKQLFKQNTLPFRPLKKKRRKPEEEQRTHRADAEKDDRRASKTVACRL